MLRNLRVAARWEHRCCRRMMPAGRAAGIAGRFSGRRRGSAITQT